MNCQHVEPQLAKHLDGRLPEREALRVAAHLSDCPACRRLRDEYLALGADLRELTTLSPPLDLERRIAERWAGERDGSRQVSNAGSMVSRLWRSPEFRLPAWGFPVIIAALLAVLLFSWWDHHPRNGLSDRLAEGSTSVQWSLIPKSGKAPAPNPSPELGGGELESALDFVPPSLSSGEGREGVWGPHLQPASALITTPQLTGLPRHSATRRTALPSEEWGRIEAQVRRVAPVLDDFVQVPFPRLAAISDPQITQAVENYKREAAIVDARLAREVTCAFKATALSDLCERLRAHTGIRLEAGASVADEKVTLFCRKRPLREVMRQLSRPFGYAWLRSGKIGEYRYELVQDLRSQLLEEELRNRARNEALLALDREMQRYRPYLHLSPDEALARSRTATPAEKPLFERLAGKGWGPTQMYFHLSPGDVAALRAGQTLDFAQEPGPKQQQLPPEVARGALQSRREVRLREDPAGGSRAQFGSAESLPDGLPPVSFPRARARVWLRLGHTELGQFTMDGHCAVEVGTQTTIIREELASGMSPTVRDPENAHRNARWSQDPALRARVTVTPAALNSQPATLNSKVTSADVLEALHQATGLPIVADYYTRLHPAAPLSLKDVPLFDALNRLADTMRLHWSREKDGNWLQFRSVSYYDDRLKEVPNRLLARWSASRRQHGGLTLDDLTEIVQLTDIQLDSSAMAEGSRDCFGLQEWDLARLGSFRPHLRYLAGLTPEQRRTAMSAAGLPFAKLSLSQQQQLVAHLGERLPSLDALTQASIRVEYLQPGEFQWVQPGTSDFQGPDRSWPANFFGLPTVRGRTRETVLQAARGIDPNVDPAQVRPTELWLAVIYRWVNPQTGKRMESGFAGTSSGGRVNW